MLPGRRFYWEPSLWREGGGGGGGAIFSPVKADIDLTMLEFVHIFETDSTLINSQIRKKTYFCQAMNLFFFLV